MSLDSNSAFNLQTKTPLLAALQSCAHKPHAPFYAPGHKHGRGSAKCLIDLLGAPVFQADLPELPELDNLFAPQGVIQQAQALAAEAFGADRTWFLANGSTSGVIAAILATCNPGDKLILPRNVHQSALSGTHPLWCRASFCAAGVRSAFGSSSQPDADSRCRSASTTP
jgi:arginine/lysine/ornithine decarboxylase